MKKRLLSCILVLVMLLGMIPTAAFAAEYSDTNLPVDGSYQVGDTYTGKEVPTTVPDNTVWVKTDEKIEYVQGNLTCTIEANHVHGNDCYELNCNHEHHEDCYSLIVGDWTVCTEDSHYHQNVCNKRCALTSGCKCQTNGQYFYHNMLIGSRDPGHGHFLVSDDFCYPGTVILAATVVDIIGDRVITEQEKAAFNNFLNSVKDAPTAFYHHDVTKGELICDHKDGHTNGCYELKCDKQVGHTHTDKCYKTPVTVYTWTLKNVNTTVFDFIHVHMDDATTADLNALEGEGVKHVRLQSTKYDKVEALLGYRYRVMAPIGVNNANWWTENFAKKITAQDITNIILAADKIQGSSDKIVIPMDGNEKYDVTLSYESVNFDAYGIDIDAILSKLPNWPTTPELPELPELPDLDLDDIQTIIDLIQALKNMDLDYEEFFRLIKIAIDGGSWKEILEILDDLDIGWEDVKDLREILEKLDKDDIQKLINILKKIDVKNLASKLNELKNLICGLKDLSRDDLLEILEDLFQNKIPDDELECMTPDELRELLKSLITKKSCSLSCLCINISKKSAPVAPTDDELKDLLKGQVVVKCTNGEASHAPKSYGWIDGGVQIGEVNGNTCPITIVTRVYADAYNKDEAPDHVTIKPETVTFNLTWVSNVWTLNVADVPVIEVACKISDEREYLTVTYSDGVDNEVVFADQVYNTLLAGEPTPKFVGTPSRIGYTFKGWKPKVSEIVTESVVYVAQWERNREPITPVGPTAPSVKVKYLNTEDHVAYIIGYENGTIRPRGEITRAEVATIFFRLMTDKARNQYWTTENDFNDVAEGQWFNLAVSTLNAAGVIVDAEYGNFRPNDPITRAELAVMAAQFCTVEGKLPKTSFTDVSKDHWAIDEIKLIEYAGWIEGYPDGTFRPDATITRAEAITIINRMLERAVEDSDMLEGMLTFIDCPTNEWFYEAVQEATNSHDYKRTKEEVEDYGYCYEIWTELEERPDWAAMEKTWLSQH